MNMVLSNFRYRYILTQFFKTDAQKMFSVVFIVTLKPNIQVVYQMNAQIGNIMELKRIANISTLSTGLFEFILVKHLLKLPAFSKKKVTF